MTDATDVTLRAFFAGWELFGPPALAAALAGAMLGVVGVYVVLRRLVFLSAATSQAAGLGVAIAFYAQAHWGLAAGLASPTAGAALFTLAGIFLITRDHGGGRRESLLGVTYLVGAAGSLAVGTRIAQELHDIETILFGSAVAVLPDDFRAVLATTILVLALHAWLWRGFAAVSFDRDGATVRGLPVRSLEASFFVALALAISVATRVLGALPTFAFSVLPALAAVRLAPNVPRALWIAAALGAGTGFGGYLAAFRWQIPVGASQALCGAALLAAAELARRIFLRR